MKNIILLMSVSSILSGCFGSPSSNSLTPFERTVTKRDGNTVTITETYALDKQSDAFKAETIINNNRIFDIMSGGVVEGNFINKSEKPSGNGLRTYEGTLMHDGSKIQGDATNETGVFAMAGGRITGKVTNQENRDDRGFIMGGGTIDGDFQNEGHFVYYGTNDASIGGNFVSTKIFTLSTAAKPLTIGGNLKFELVNSIRLLVNAGGFKNTSAIIQTKGVIDFNNVSIGVDSKTGLITKGEKCILFEGNEIQNFTPPTATQEFSIERTDNQIILTANKDINKAPYISFVSSFDFSGNFKQTIFTALSVVNEENLMGMQYRFNNHISSQIVYHTHQDQDNAFCKHFKTLSAHIKAQKPLLTENLNLAPYLFAGYGFMFDTDETLKNNSILVQESAGFVGMGINMQKKVGIISFTLDSRFSKELSPREIKVGSGHTEYVDVFSSSLMLGINADINDHAKLSVSGNAQKNHAHLDHKFEIALDCRF